MPCSLAPTHLAQAYALGRLEIPTCYRGRILVGGPPCMVPKNLWPTGSQGLVSTNHAQPYTLGRLEVQTCYRGRILVGGPPCMVPKNLWPTGSKRRHPANGAEWVPVKHYAHFSFWRCPTNSAGAGSSDHTVVAMYGLMTITCGRLIQRSLASSVIIFALLLQQQ